MNILTQDEVLLYARQRGLQNLKIVHRGGFGLELYGEGEGENGWPLCWQICRELDISWGGGNGNYHQIRKVERNNGIR